MNYASGAVTPLDPEMVQVGDAVGQRAERCGLFQGAVHEQVPGLRHHPGLDRMPGGTQDPHAAGAVLDHGKDVHESELAEFTCRPGVPRCKACSRC